MEGETYNTSGDSLRIDRFRIEPAQDMKPTKRPVLPPCAPEQPVERSRFQALRISVILEIEIPIAPNADRHELEADIIDALGTVIVPRVPYLTKIQLAHSMECETDFSTGVQTITTNTNQADRSAEPSTAGQGS